MPSRLLPSPSPFMVYLDYAATTPVDPRAAEQMIHFLGPEGVFGNSASRTHRYGWEAAEAVERSRQYVADLLTCDTDEIVWTSGATESDNLAIKGVAYAHADRGRHIVTSAIEHKAVLDTCRFLESQGFEVSYLRPDAGGVIIPQQVEAAMRPNTILVSLMHVNNETGAIADLDSIARIAHEHGAVFHTDAAQSASRLPLDMRRNRAHLVSLSGHKMYGPKGIGALFVRRDPRLRLQPQIHGGGHEWGIRSGTLPTHQIVGMGEAARLLSMERDTENARVADLSRKLLDRLMAIDDTIINGDRERCVPGIVNVSFDAVDSEALVLMLNEAAVSTGSACTSASVEPSHVLIAMGLGEDRAHSALRLSLGRFTTEEDIDRSVDEITGAVRELRDLTR
ncbi:MAG: aminotransferase class V-fold PLP-dependent enzyme [Chloroflexi bacterium]|nr:aminotransferase class V-fold PLP-dependent enzyme [Chloroflexota bacterium]MYK35497.1 aminotransferase class V-fold PLP-dependent enzyme [Chloroflexota bacterium]